MAILPHWIAPFAGRIILLLSSDNVRLLAIRFPLALILPDAVTCPLNVCVFVSALPNIESPWADKELPILIDVVELPLIFPDAVILNPSAKVNET